MKLAHIYMFSHVYTHTDNINQHPFDCPVFHNPAFKKWQGFTLSSLYVFHLSIPDLLCSES